MQKIPLAALAAILVFTGFKLASPRVFKQAYGYGMEQLIFLVSTILITLNTDLLWGILGGTGITLLVHILLARAPVPSFFYLLFTTKVTTTEIKGKLTLIVEGIANFFNILKVNKALKIN